MKVSPAPSGPRYPNDWSCSLSLPYNCLLMLLNILQGVVKLGAVDADQHKSLAGQYGVQGFPTIKIFSANKNKPEEYQGSMGHHRGMDGGALCWHVWAGLWVFTMKAAGSILRRGVLQ